MVKRIAPVLGNLLSVCLSLKGEKAESWNSKFLWISRILYIPRFIGIP
jgi:hypothetical protein